MDIKEIAKDIAEEVGIGAASIGMQIVNNKLGLQDDNLLEEIVEQGLEKAIDMATGEHRDIDLTPSSPEKK